MADRPSSKTSLFRCPSRTIRRSKAVYALAILTTIGFLRMTIRGGFEKADLRSEGYPTTIHAISHRQGLSSPPAIPPRCHLSLRGGGGLPGPVGQAPGEAEDAVEEAEELGEEETVARLGTLQNNLEYLQKE
eukprot:1322975-Amorphochlora_amoeboformis.AAC.2